MVNILIVGISACFLVFPLYLLATNSKYREAIYYRLGLTKRRWSGASTPPKSPSESRSGFVSNTSRPEYADVFPPHRRAALAELQPQSLNGFGPSLIELSRLPPDYSKLIPDKSASNSDEVIHHTTATGFTLEEIRRLGDFPDYATLSGIPLPSPYESFDIRTAMPRPYRPYRWPYHQTMSLSKLDHDFWLELDKNYVSVMEQREKIFKQEGESVLQMRSGSEIACKELMEMCLEFLVARYPQYFSLDKRNMVFHNKLLQSRTDLKATLPLHVLLHNVPEDFAIMIRDPETGIYSFRGGMIMSALGWNLGSKIGLKLHEIHAPIPEYKEKMQFSMDRYFAKKPTEKAIQRGSWGLEIDQPLYMPPGDPHEALREQQNPDHTIDRCHLRVDWQTLRRLPLSGAVVFNFKGLFTPVTEFRDEPYIPSLILKVLKDGKPNMMEYKNTWHTEHVVVPALEEYERHQVQKGLIEKDWEPKSLDQSPFFPGWEEKWHRQQGF